MKLEWAKQNGLNRKRALSVSDGEGRSWGVYVGIEGSRGKPRYNIRGMQSFVDDKGLHTGDKLHFLFFKNQGSFRLSNVVRGDGN